MKDLMQYLINKHVAPLLTFTCVLSHFTVEIFPATWQRALDYRNKRTTGKPHQTPQGKAYNGAPLFKRDVA